MIDATDRAILRHVQRDSGLTATRLGELVGLAPTTVQRRLARLRAAGVIEAEVAVVSPAAVGRPLLLLVAVTLARERPDLIDRLKRDLRARPQVMSAYYVTGEADFVLVVSARDMEEYDALTREVLAAHPDIRGFRTTVVMDRVKASFELPL